MKTALVVAIPALLAIAACSSNNGNGVGSASDGGGGSTADVSGDAFAAKDPNSAPLASIDRFSDGFAHLFKRSANSSLPGPNAPIDCDQGPFITHGFGPSGEKVVYYNFDVLPATPAPIYVFFPEGSSDELTAQLHVVGVIPGDPGYNDFWQVVKVTLPAGYVPNSITSVDELMASGFQTTPTATLVNCPIVPAGSTASLRFTSQESAALVHGWYKDQIVEYFNFAEHPLMVANGMVPTAPIYVTFNINPDPSNPMSGPPSGFMTEPGSMQTHNVASVLPTDMGYSPLWQVVAYDDAAFSTVHDAASVAQAKVIVPNAGLVNCPIVSSATSDGG
jgi:hypothetical protein